jgi:hypothetical protein
VDACRHFKTVCISTKDPITWLVVALRSVLFFLKVSTVVVLVLAAGSGAMDDGRKDSRPYIAGAGDFWPVCDPVRTAAGINPGCVVFPLEPGETVVSFQVDDLLNDQVGGLFGFLDENDEGVGGGGSYCGEVEGHPIPPGAVWMGVMVSTAFGALDCRFEHVGTGTAGTVQAQFFAS